MTLAMLATSLRVARTAELRGLATSCRCATERASDDEGLTGADKLLHDALRLEAEEKRTLARQSNQPDPNDPAWTGEERVQDTVLRMVMDKYKPLRIRLGDDAKDPADEKIKAGIQQPSSPGTPPVVPVGANRSLVNPSLRGEGEYEEGRKLPKTPDAKPWRAVYVRPAHLGSAAQDVPSVYYGQFLKSASTTPVGAGASSEMRSKLKAAGMNASALPVDDTKRMTQLRQGIKTAERRGKLLRARDSVLDYQLSKPPPHSVFAASATEGEMRGDEVSDTTSNLQLQLGHAQGWDSVVEKRIKAAQEAGLFRENKLRGRPIQRDMEEKNPFLAREEYFMNRIVKRQGAAPPWVELNLELETELTSWRQRCAESWIRRASRMITTSPHLSAGLEPVSARVGAQEAEMVATTDGERALVDTAKRYRDPEWEQREHAYHTHELTRLNQLIRKHNHLAPFTARKGLMQLELELAAMYTRALPRLVREISTILTQNAGGSPSHALDRALQHGDQPVSYDMWGRELRAPTTTRPSMLDAWWGSAVAERKQTDTAQTPAHAAAEHERAPSLGIVAAIQRSLQWARQRIGA